MVERLDKTNMLSNLLTITLAPSFVLLLHYFEFTEVVLVYLIMAIIFFIYSYAKKTSYKDMVMPSIYIVALSVAFYFSSLESVKYIPVTLSCIFLLLFIDAHYNKKEMILEYTKKFYKKELKYEESEFLKKGDGYWVIVMLINTLIHLYVVNFSSNVIWAFYASVGWYILFFTALIIQIIYGRFYAIQMYSR